MASLPSVRGTYDVVVLPGRVAFDAARRVERLLVSVEELARGVGALEREFKGLRTDMREVIDGVERLRGDVRSMGDGVDGIRGSTHGMERQIDGVAVSLERIDALAGRISRFGVRRPGRSSGAGSPSAP